MQIQLELHKPKKSEPTREYKLLIRWDYVSAIDLHSATMCHE